MNQFFQVTAQIFKFKSALKNKISTLKNFKSVLFLIKEPSYMEKRQVGFTQMEDKIIEMQSFLYT